MTKESLLIKLGLVTGTGNCVLAALEAASLGDIPWDAYEDETRSTELLCKAFEGWGHLEPGKVLQKLMPILQDKDHAALVSVQGEGEKPHVYNIELSEGGLRASGIMFDDGTGAWRPEVERDISLSWLERNLDPAEDNCMIVRTAALDFS